MKVTKLDSLLFIKEKAKVSELTASISSLRQSENDLIDKMDKMVPIGAKALNDTIESGDEDEPTRASTPKIPPEQSQDLFFQKYSKPFLNML